MGSAQRSRLPLLCGASRFGIADNVSASELKRYRKFIEIIVYILFAEEQCDKQKCKLDVINVIGLEKTYVVETPPDNRITY